MKDLERLVSLLEGVKNRSELRALLGDLLTPSEIKALVDRWDTVSLLLAGESHREVQRRVGISISKVTHAANLLKEGGKGFRALFSRQKK